MSKRSAAPGAKPNPLELFLAQHAKIGIDTSVFIYQIEENEKYVEVTQRIFDWLEGPRARAVTSTITMLELLVHPYRANDSESLDSFYALLSTYPHLEWLPLTLSVADQAASLRARHNLKTPDAVQAATALAETATGFITNDPVFHRVEELEVLILDEVLQALAKRQHRGPEAQA
jgi:predicted nucleic acid-binding protein